MDTNKYAYLITKTETEEGTTYTKMNAVKYTFPEGSSTVETTVVYPADM